MATADTRILQAGSTAADLFSLGKTFDSFSEFETKFEAYKKESFSVYRIVKSDSVAAENKRRAKPIPECMKYSYISMCCVHYGDQRPSTSSGARPKQRFGHSF